MDKSATQVITVVNNVVDNDNNNNRRVASVTVVTGSGDRGEEPRVFDPIDIRRVPLNNRTSPIPTPPPTPAATQNASQAGNPTSNGSVPPPTRNTELTEGAILRSLPDEITVYTVDERRTDTAEMSNRDLNLNYFFSIMRDERERLFSFEAGNWRVPFLSKEDLAHAGFFYLMNSDRVQCAFCRGVICSWEPGDVPLVEHKKHYPRCPWLLGYDVGNIAIGTDPVQGNKRARGRDVCGGSHPVRVSPTSEAFTRIYRLPNVKTVTLEEFGVRVHKGAANTRYSSSDARYLSFNEKWPKVKYDPRELAEAGFYFTGTSDCVKCFYCDGGVCDWDKARNPWIEHGLRFPDCDYVLLNKGPSFLEACKRTYSLEMIEVSLRREQHLENMIISDWMKSKVIEDLKRIRDYPDEILDAVLRARWKRVHRAYEHVGELNNDVIAHIASIAPSSEKDKEQKVEKAKKPSDEKEELPLSRESISSNEDSSPLSSLSSSPSSSMSSSPPPSIDRDRLVCKACLDKEVCVMFLPCAHLVTCSQCALSVSFCPLCRSEIKGHVRTYLA
ncbi:putative inhibitor of apoptosis-like protein [Dinothrombium tinctorium]|uniref:Putative inhibitor of apoptosis-like protein n=1 Tax=Dinothrombium tinctorium TaxID=1965070 RepID=A0A3S3PA47_9ACAR|nr:putative inhibitor of apoptosis-like protein [Dinothrombium tinctorium]